VHGDDGHGRIELTIAEGQVFRHGVDGRGQRSGALGPH
jgi:hypothetical protein